jgi:putative iron-dependent peroxidase
MSLEALVQPAILAPVPPVGTALVFDLDPGMDPRPGLTALRTEPADGCTILGLGAPLALAMRARVEGLRGFPALRSCDPHDTSSRGSLSGAGVAFPSTQGALWVFLRGTERGTVLDRAMGIQRKLGAGWRLLDEVDAFRYREGRDLTGYEDGTENPKDEAAVAAAIVARGGDGMVGGSFVAVQRFVHDLARFQGLEAAARDAVIGRRAETNEEIDDAVATAHVKRTAQESFEPPAFMVRRSMPWGGVREHGLYFVAYVEALDRFERVLRRMAGLEDGEVDALLGVTRATSGGYYFCPPMSGGSVDLRSVGMPL